ncbi:hypothetical protein HF086_009279 [Spodoptera exigua]|uniref:tRNA (guanine(26)-N(2))-dimethyltransferase n=1 Tax=Spodoptera exigua TaxID=7107 RepID=A0A922ME12_SPOEX|nr:hypothetical protein HF086_009279 [Spodoptera exigua]
MNVARYCRVATTLIQRIMKMDASTATKSIKEGKAEICLTTEKVFYNPVQEFNRDLSIAVLTIFTNEYKAEQLAKAEKRGKNKTQNTTEGIAETQTNNEVDISILEALSATGLRSIRYAKEVPNVTKIVANDLSKQAVETIQANIVHNQVENLIETSHDDACNRLRPLWLSVSVLGLCSPKCSGWWTLVNNCYGHGSVGWECS